MFLQTYVCEFCDLIIFLTGIVKLYIFNKHWNDKNDILNVIRFNSFDAAFDSKRKKLGILKSEKNNLISTTEISNQILTLIYAIDDPELRSGVKEAFNCLDKSVKNLDFFLNALIEKEYFNLFDWIEINYTLQILHVMVKIQRYLYLCTLQYRSKQVVYNDLNCLRPIWTGLQISIL